eukprot:scaffold1881_cov169-Amphora_coffeaeformis.AAC.2
MDNWIAKFPILPTRASKRRVVVPTGTFAPTRVHPWRTQSWRTIDWHKKSLGRVNPTRLASRVPVTDPWECRPGQGLVRTLVLPVHVA